MPTATPCKQRPAGSPGHSRDLRIQCHRSGQGCNIHLWMRPTSRLLRTTTQQNRCLAVPDPPMWVVLWLETFYRGPATQMAGPQTSWEIFLANHRCFRHQALRVLTLFQGSVASAVLFDSAQRYRELEFRNSQSPDVPADDLRDSDGDVRSETYPSEQLHRAPVVEQRYCTRCGRQRVAMLCADV